MAKKNKSKKSTPTEQENTILPIPVDDVKVDSQQNDSELGNDVGSSSSTQATRRQKKNRKQQEKKKSDGGGQTTTVESPKIEIVHKDEEKSSCIAENDDGSSWKNVGHSSRKLKNVNNINKVTEVADEVHPYKQQKKDTKPLSTRDNKGDYDHFNDKPIKDLKNNDRKPKDAYKQQKITSYSARNDKSNFDHFNNKPVNDSKYTDRKPKDYGKPRREDNNGDIKSSTSSKAQTDKDFDNFNNLFKGNKFKETYYGKVQEIQEDLFNMPETFALAHCVAEDMSMGSGIAVQFSQKFKRRDELYQQKARQGGLAVLNDKERFIYYLVTKKLSNGKPTTYTMWNSLQKMKQHIQDHQVNKLALPRIGCGLDRLEWSEVKAMIEYTFKDVDIDITVCNFQQPEEESLRGSNTKQFKCPVRNVRYPLVDIEPGTAIIYFGTVNGHISEDMESLDNKFRIVGEYKRANRKLGDVIQVYKNDQQYSLLGCIARNTEKDPFDFVSFQKCIVQIKKLNKSYYGYVGIQAFLDEDDLLLSKITTMLRYSLIKVDVYVCWGGKMLEFMPPDRGGDFI